MSLSKIKGFLLQFQLDAPQFGEAKGFIPVRQMIDIIDVPTALVKEGTYTPNNDYLFLWQNIPAESSPNLIFIMSPTIMNVSITAGGVLLANSVPSKRIFMQLLPPNIDQKADNIYFEGRTNVPYPMAQGIPVDYFAVMAKATF